jgi:hypothetical protein
MAQVVECPPQKYKALSSTQYPHHQKKRIKERKRERKSKPGKSSGTVAEDS